MLFLWVLLASWKEEEEEEVLGWGLDRYFGVGSGSGFGFGFGAGCWAGEDLECDGLDGLCWIRRTTKRRGDDFGDLMI